MSLKKPQPQTKAEAEAEGARIYTTVSRMDASPTIQPPKDAPTWVESRRNYLVAKARTKKWQPVSILRGFDAEASQ